VTLLDLGLSGCEAVGAIKCLEHLFKEMKSFAMENNLYLHMNASTRTILSWSSHADYPTGFWFKGADTVVVIKFLIWKYTGLLESVAERNNADYLNEILNCLNAANDFMSTLYRSGLFLSRLRLTRVVRVGKAMLSSYSLCARAAFH
ncbi:unnamed protein product, partial [Symbiodinium pilosum]